MFRENFEAGAVVSRTSAKSMILRRHARSETRHRLEISLSGISGEASVSAVAPDG